MWNYLIDNYRTVAFFQCYIRNFSLLYLPVNKINQVSCNKYSLDSICLPRGLPLEEIDDISKVIKRKKTLQRVDFIYREGDVFKSVLAIKSGTAKLVAEDYQGNEHILNILLPGELLGFNGIYNPKNRS